VVMGPCVRRDDINSHWRDGYTTSRARKSAIAAVS
jgi:hypothetical protein